MTERRVALGGPVNFRDLGGYATADGRRVAWRRLYRSDSLHHLVPEDGPLLHARGIATAIDFRAGDELDRIGIGRLGELDIRHVHLPTVDQVLHTVRLPDREMPRSAAEVYLHMLRGGAIAYAAALRTIAEADVLPAVYFCMAGKDRTGVFSAIVLGLLGVSDDDIVADYVLTEEVVETIHARGRVSHPDAADHWKDLPEDLMGAKAASMEGLVAGVHRDWGGWGNYVEDIGVDRPVVDALRAQLLEPNADHRP